MTVPEKKVNSVDDTTGFMAAARARLNTSEEKETAIASNESCKDSKPLLIRLTNSRLVVNSTQGAGLVELETKNKATAPNEIGWFDFTLYISSLLTLYLS